MPVPLEREVWVHEVYSPALVLGSTQPDGVVDRHKATLAGVEVARRRSGGGAVLVRPLELLWVDVLLPSDDPLWDDDVGRSFGWLGQAWAAAVGGRAVAHDGPIRHTEWSRLVCFAGLGPGEVTFDGAKCVGISQRRTRAGARFQCAAVLRPWDPAPLLDLLVLPPDARARATADLADVATPAAADGEALLERLLAALP
jgi:lipoate-protein ligase A